MQQYIVKGFFTMAVEAEGWPEAKQTAKRILRNDGIKAIALEAMENKNGKKGGREMSAEDEGEGDAP